MPLTSTSLSRSSTLQVIWATNHKSSKFTRYIRNCTTCKDLTFSRGRFCIGGLVAYI